MDQIYSLTEAKAKFSEIINRIIFKKERFVITKKGKAVAMVFPIGQEKGAGAEEGLILAQGALGELDDEYVDGMVEHIYESRNLETDRKVNI